MDKEKVIKGLEECAGNGKCTKCQYGKEKQALSCKKLLEDALELLKQEAIESIDFGDKTETMANLEGLTWDDWRMYHSDTEVQNIAKSAFDLLVKEHEPVEPISKQISRFNKRLNETIYWCGKCKAPIEKNQSYCGCCGQKVKWDV